MSMYCYMVTIELDTPLYLTDFHRDIQFNGHTYIAGKLSVTSAVSQKSQPSANDFSILLSAVDQTMVSAFADNPYKNRRCLIERVEFNDNETINSYETWLDGDCNKYSYTNKLTESTLKLSLTSIFGAFDAVNMLNLGVQFSDSINVDETKYWGKNAPTTPTNTGGGNARNTGFARV